MDLHTFVIEGSAPLLIGQQALKTLRVLHDHDKDRLFLLGTQETVPLELGPHEHHLIDLFNYKGSTSSAPAVAARSEAVTAPEERTDDQQSNLTSQIVKPSILKKVETKSLLDIALEKASANITHGGHLLHSRSSSSLPESVGPAGGYHQRAEQPANDTESSVRFEPEHGGDSAESHSPVAQLRA